MLTFKQRAAKRIESILSLTDDETVADIIADVLHYCSEHELSFADEVLRAEQYVSEELSIN